MSDWEGESDYSGPKKTFGGESGGRNFGGKGRGFTRNDDGDSFRGGGGGRGRGFGGGFNDKKNDDNGFKPTKSFGNDDGFKPTNFDDDGFKPINFDDDGFKPTNDDDGFKPTNDDGGFRPTNSYKSRGDDDGGFKPSYDRGDRGDRGGRGRGGRGGGFRRDDNGGGYKSYNSDRNGGGDENGDDGGFKPSYNRDGGERRGRGRGRGGYNSDRNGGGGGYGGGDDDGNDGGFKPSYNRDGGDRGGRGRDRGFNSDRNGGGGYGGGGGGGDDDGDDGGFKPFNRDGDRGRGRGGRGRGRGGDRGGGGGFRRDGDGEGGDRDFGGGGGGGGGFGDDDGEKKEPINKEIYIPPEPEQDEEKMFDSGIGEGINFKNFDKIKVKVNEGMPPPIESFESAGLRPFVVDNIKKCHYTTPTPIQKYALPIIMAGHDLMACAQTGSGKTAAFMVPIINTLLSNPRDLVCHGEHCEPQCLVMAPTRELVIQIADECRKFASSSILKIEVAYGGTAVGYQAKRILNGAHIVVGTAGRLTDFVDRGRIQLGSIRYLVLDEADRMLDMGFMKAVEKVVDHETMAQDRQTLMFSATFPEEIQKLSGRFLKPDYGFITVGIVGGANEDVEQNFHEVNRKQKKPRLVEILDKERENNTLAGTIIFVETKKTADFLAAYLSENNYPTTSIHGDRLQSQREEALRDFRYQKMQILVATNVAARGLDIKGVSHVIQYDISKEIDMHVHRIGRTGRVGNKGRATTFYDPESDGAMAGDLVRILQQAGQPIPDFLQSGDSGISFQPGRSNFGAHDFRQSGNAPKTDFNAAETGGEPEEDW